MPNDNIYSIGDLVSKKIWAAAAFVGEVRAVFTKKNGDMRYVVENSVGVLHIYSGKNLIPKVKE